MNFLYVEHEKSSKIFNSQGKVFDQTAKYTWNKYKCFKDRVKEGQKLPQRTDKGGVCLHLPNLFMYYKSRPTCRVYLYPTYTTFKWHNLIRQRKKNNEKVAHIYTRLIYIHNMCMGILILNKSRYILDLLKCCMGRDMLHWEGA